MKKFVIVVKYWGERENVEVAWFDNGQIARRFQRMLNEMNGEGYAEVMINR